MKILLYLLVPLLIVAVAAGVQWVRNRQPSSLESGVDAFQREMRALSPDDAPATRRRDPGTGTVAGAPRPGPGKSSGSGPGTTPGAGPSSTSGPGPGGSRTAQPPRRPPSPDRPSPDRPR